ncbi:MULTISPECIES: cytochrome P450 [unclassified Streptomyces]|uniref:cytochrome P450 n=1 Tax=unclassified Streptomyces TaxID=2593676 RepID=UPI00081DA7F0|nr:MULTISPECIES: cytochrome P450 [unclassified Streptomyces]SCE03927.1 unspecific monooxygenase [Streptomyces sp. TverLS-915]SCE98625.1 unspecific monooxygenase [Streptomyces sp. LcepLS]
MSAPAATPRPLAPAAFDHGDPAFLADPYPVYAALREAGRVLHYAPSGQWLVPHHADVSALLRDRRLGRSYQHRYTHEEFGRTPPPRAHAPFHELNDLGMLELEPPDHTRIRRLVSHAFTPRTVEALRPYVTGLARDLADALAERGGGDLLTEVAEPLPVAVIAELLGVPEADRPLLRPWSAAICAMYELNPSEETARRAVAASAEFSAYLRALIADRARRPGDDLVSALVAAREAGDRLSEAEIVATCALLLNAGHEATVGATVNGWHALLTHPDQLAALRASHGLVPTAVEELLRYDTPLQLFERWVLDDIEIGGVTIPRGEELALLFGSANHDPAVFAEPHRLDLTRPAVPHVSFSAGIHYCVGAPLARLELTASLAALLDRAPGLHLAGEARRRPNFVMRGFAELPVGV